LPYVSKSERAAASRMTWTEIIKHVREAEQCDEREACRQIGNAVADRKLRVWWADESKPSFGSSPLQVPSDEPPRDAIYWQECEAHPKEPDLVREPPPYDREWVNKRTAARLDKKRRFRKPIFNRDHALLLWPQARSAATAGGEKRVTAILAEALKSNKNLRRDDAFNKCRELYPKLSQRGFLSRVWPRAREAAELSPLGSPGPKPKQKPNARNRCG
jgi:hypothetical protein